MAVISFSCKLKKYSPIYFSAFETGYFAIPFYLLGQAELNMVTSVKKKYYKIVKHIIILGNVYWGSSIIFSNIAQIYVINVYQWLIELNNTQVIFMGRSWLVY